MQDIGQYTGDNIGGLEKFQFIPVNDIISIPRATNHVITEAITIDALSGAQWFDAYVTEGSLGYKETEKKNQHGNSYDRILVGLVPKDTETLADLFDEMEGFRYVIIYTDNNGKKKVVGSIESPLQFKADMDTKVDANGRNGHPITFFGSSSHKAYFYNLPVG